MLVSPVNLEHLLRVIHFLTHGTAEPDLVDVHHVFAVAVFLLEKLAAYLALELRVVGAAVGEHVFFELPSCLETFTAHFARQLHTGGLEAQLFKVFRFAVFGQV